MLLVLQEKFEAESRGFFAGIVYVANMFGKRGDKRLVWGTDSKRVQFSDDGGSATLPLFPLRLPLDRGPLLHSTMGVDVGFSPTSHQKRPHLTGRHFRFQLRVQIHFLLPRPNL